MHSLSLSFSLMLMQDLTTDGCGLGLYFYGFAVRGAPFFMALIRWSYILSQALAGGSAIWRYIGFSLRRQCVQVKMIFAISAFSYTDWRIYYCFVTCIRKIFDQYIHVCCKCNGIYWLKQDTCCWWNGINKQAVKVNL